GAAGGHRIGALEAPLPPPAPPAGPAPHELQFAQHRLARRDHPAALVERAAPRRCRRDVPPRALEDAHAELLLERRDAAAERRLADLQRGGGTAEVAVARQHDGGLQQTEGDIHAGNVSAWPVVCLLGRAAFPPPSLGVALLK